MTTRAVAAELLSAFDGEMQIALGPAHAPLAFLVEQIKDIECTPEALKSELRPISVVEAHALLWSVLHQSIAHTSELMPAERAMQLAWRFIDSFGFSAKFFSTTVAPEDPREGIRSWSFEVSSHTFEALLCCRGEHSSALLLVTDED